MIYAQASPTTTASLLKTLEHGREPARARATFELYRRLSARDDHGDVLYPVLDSGDPDARARACELIAAAPSLRDAQPLLQALRDVDAHVRSRAALALARHRVATPAAALLLLAGAGDPDPTVHSVCLAALAVIVPSPPVVRAAGTPLIGDRYGVARRVREPLASAQTPTLTAALPLLSARDPLVRRAGLEVICATRLNTDMLAEPIARLLRAGIDPYVRRAAVRALGHLRSAEPGWIEQLTVLTRDWDPGLRSTATVALGRLAPHIPSAAGRFVDAVHSLETEELPELAAALRACRRSKPPHGPLLDRLTLARGYVQLDLADAIIGPYRARSPVHGIWVDGVELPFAHCERLDDALERVEAHERTRTAATFLERTADPAPVVRACCAVFATYLDLGIATGIVLQRLSDADPDPSVRNLARALLAGIAAR